MTTIDVQRLELPPVPVPDELPICDWHTVATATAGDVQGEVVRFDYFDPIDGRADVEATFEVRIDGVPEIGAGMSDVMSENPEQLEDLAAVCKASADILRACQQAVAHVS